MNCLLLTVLAVTAATCLSGIFAKPAAGDVSIADAIVEIVRQKLVKFPDELSDQRNLTTTNGAADDEARRILAQIEKVNQALGYVKKQAGESQAKTPPLLDSSQYLFPKPAYHPFHEHNHQMTSAHGATLLVPSIRAVHFTSDDTEAVTDSNQINYNVPPLKRTNFLKTDSVTSTVAHQWHSSNSPPVATTTRRTPTPATPTVPTPPTPAVHKTDTSAEQFYFRPHRVHVPAPQTNAEREQLPSHFVLPVRLYKHNKEQFVRQHSPQQYNVKGYKIVGDIDHFYGKSKGGKQKQPPLIAAGKTKNTPKYHLFFLPRELVLNEQNGHFKQDIAEVSGATLMPPASSQELAVSREEKLASRPFKQQTTSNTITTQKNGTTSTINASGITQVIRKRIVPKPLREKETIAGPAAVPQPLPSGGHAVSSTSIKITPPPLGINTLTLPAAITTPTAQPAQALGLPADGQTAQTAIVAGGNTNKIGNNFSLFGFNSNKNDATAGGTNNNNNKNATNVIKTAFQNIFKFPFRPDQQRPRPGEAVSLQSVPLQQPHQTTYFTAQQLQPHGQQQLYVPAQSVYQMATQPLSGHNQDYKWDDENSNSNSNSAANDDDDDDDDSATAAAGGADDSSMGAISGEEKIFGHHHKQQQSTQREAIKQGGIIIQRLKVRKGGIAIAGPGGVATAGSGGTAIVGPGGYALTHPRSLTIAGPGAKVIAIPAHIDLQDALQRTNLEEQTFPREGRIVATGPTVYYAPGTGEGTGEAVDEGAVALQL